LTIKFKLYISSNKRKTNREMSRANYPLSFLELHKLITHNKKANSQKAIAKAFTKELSSKYFAKSFDQKASVTLMLKE